MHESGSSPFKDPVPAAGASHPGCGTTPGKTIHAIRQPNSVSTSFLDTEHVEVQSPAAAAPASTGLVWCFLLCAHVWQHHRLQGLQFQEGDSGQPLDRFRPFFEGFCEHRLLACVLQPGHHQREHAYLELPASDRRGPAAERSPEDTAEAFFPDGLYLSPLHLLDRRGECLLQPPLQRGNREPGAAPVRGRGPEPAHEPGHIPPISVSDNGLEGIRMERHSLSGRPDLDRSGTLQRSRH